MLNKLPQLSATLVPNSVNPTDTIEYIIAKPISTLFPPFNIVFIASTNEYKHIIAIII